MARRGTVGRERRVAAARDRAPAAELGGQGRDGIAVRLLVQVASDDHRAVDVAQGGQQLGGVPRPLARRQPEVHRHGGDAAPSSSRARASTKPRRYCPRVFENRCWSDRTMRQGDRNRTAFRSRLNGAYDDAQSMPSALPNARRRYGAPYSCTSSTSGSYAMTASTAGAMPARSDRRL